MAGRSGRVLSHRLSNGLYVSGSPDQHKGRRPTVSIAPVPYTGGDMARSGELGRMLEMKAEDPKPKRNATPQRASSKPAHHKPKPVFSAPTSPRPGPLASSKPRKSFAPLSPSSAPTVFSVPASPHSGPRASSRALRSSGPLSPLRAPNIFSLPASPHSGPLASSKALRRSGPFSPLKSPSANRQASSMALNLPATGLITSDAIDSGPLSSSGEPKRQYGPAGTQGSKKSRRSASSNQALNKLSYDSIHMWNRYWRKRALTGYINNFKDMGLDNVKDGQHVKITGVVTCGSISIQSSFQKMDKCVFACTRLYEYRSIGAKPARPGHAFFTWGLRHAECLAVDFYISDIHSGLRALVKTGYNSRVIPIVKDSTVLDVTKNKESPPNFLNWLTEKSLSSENRVMRLKESFVREGATATVWGVAQRHENVIMIVPPLQQISTNCQFNGFFLPANLESIILKCCDSSAMDIMPV